MSMTILPTGSVDRQIDAKRRRCRRFNDEGFFGTGLIHRFHNARFSTLEAAEGTPIMMRSR